MSALDLVTGVSTAAEATAHLMRQLRQLWAAVRDLRRRHPSAAYENLLLELVLDIQDRRGLRAVLERRQRVRFLADEAEVVRELVWGEGEQLSRYSVRGACRLLIRPEGSKRAVLLGLAHRPRKGEQALLRSRRVIRNGFRLPTEYCETVLERATQRVVITVIFPLGRPPNEARLVVTPQQRNERTVPIRFAADGRAFLRWSLAQPSLDRTYSLRWSW
jgi:hypothetical protein